jgi:isopenicillin N synthase-like dioxygenase
VSEVSELTQVTWSQLQDGSADQSMLPGLRASGVILLRHCPAQMLTPPPLLHSALADLFGLPLDVLMTYRCVDVKNDSGYIPANEPGKRPGPVGWHVVSESRKTSAGYSASVWPAEAPRVRRVIGPYYRSLELTADAILAAVGRCFSLSPGYFGGLRPGGDDVMRLLHYQVEPGQPPPDMWRHTDYGLLTLYPPASQPGLELLIPTGGWQPAIVPEDAVLVGVGSALTLLTSGELPALIHRIVCPDGMTERFAAQLFVNASPGTALVPFVGSSGEVAVGATGDARIYEEFFRERARRSAMIASGELSLSEESEGLSAEAPREPGGASDGRRDD